MYVTFVRNKFYNKFILIYNKDSEYCVAVIECKLSVWGINILSDFILIYIMDSGYCLDVRECTESVWEINIITGFYVNLY
jgi:hypothetical protein